ncbi:hypothetical protein [Reyranella sp.]|uniref:hypothetical protein n=1 Tax=Reyranella sp. TaxID=1929291 RepID=UPI004035B2B4
MSYAGHFQLCLENDLRDLIPLVGEVLKALDKPGSRALRRKLDKEMHSLVHTYGTLCRAQTDECGWDELRDRLPRYSRVTEVWPAGKTLEARKAAAAAGDAPPIESPPEIPAVGRGLRLVVDNGRTSRDVAWIEGGAA